MLKIKEYVKADNLAQAYELNQKRANRIIGGMLWMKMSNAQIHTAIDLSGLGLDQIEETEEEFRIGCMVTLRELELNSSLALYSQGIVRESVKNIVGVQFRNLATIGGSIFGRFGFSDVLTCFLAMDTYVELYHGGILPLEEFAARKYDNDILVRIIVKKTHGRYVYLSHRNTKTDFPVLTAALAKACNDNEGGIKVVVGARPAKAICLRIPKQWTDRADDGVFKESDLEELAAELSKQFPMQSNMRGSAGYRTHLAEVLIRRGLLKLQEETGGGRDAD